MTVLLPLGEGGQRQDEGNKLRSVFQPFHAFNPTLSQWESEFHTPQQNTFLYIFPTTVDNSP